MPTTTITIDREQRQPLHRLVSQHISGIGDVNLMIEAGNFVSAERLGLEFGEDIRLLDDLGWDPQESRSSFELTLPREELIVALKRLRLEAEEGLQPREEHAAREEHEEVISYLVRAKGICGELIEALGADDSSTEAV